MRLLLINANTTEAVTDACVRAARSVALPGTDVSGVTGKFGAEIISSRAQNAVAGHALLDLVEAHADESDCILIAVSYDTALLAAREASPVPVVGMTQAGLLSASLLSDRIGMVCFSTPHLYGELARGYGLGDQIAGIRTIELDPRTAYSDAGATQRAVSEAAKALVAESGAQVIVLCGAAMAGMARDFADFDVPVLDGITAGVAMCEALVRQMPVRR